MLARASDEPYKRWAEAGPAVAVIPYGELCGYVVEGSSPRVRSRLGVDGLVCGPLLDCALLRDGSPPFTLPQGVIGAGCGLAFVLGRTFPDEGELVTRDTLAGALVTCHMSIEVLGRPPEAIRLDAASRAGSAPDVACHLGPAIRRWRALDLTSVALDASLDGNVVAHGEPDRDPLDAVQWLAEVLVAHDRTLEAGQIVVTGSRVGILQVLPGQALRVTSAMLGSLAVSFA